MEKKNNMAEEKKNEVGIGEGRKENEEGGRIWVKGRLGR